MFAYPLLPFLGIGLMRLECYKDVTKARSSDSVEDAWRVEIERRMAELDSGTVKTIPWEELRARLYRR